MQQMDSKKAATKAAKVRALTEKRAIQGMQPKEIAIISFNLTSIFPKTSPAHTQTHNKQQSDSFCFFSGYAHIRSQRSCDREVNRAFCSLLFKVWNEFN